MNEHVKNFLNTRLIYFLHCVLYAFFLIMNLETMFDPNVKSMNYSIWKSLVFIILIVIMFVVETVYYLNKSNFLKREMFWAGFRLFQMVVFAMYGFLMPQQIGQSVCFVTLMLFAIEAIFFFRFDEKPRRIFVYIALGTPFEAFVIWKIMNSSKVFEAIDYFITASAVLVASILICETISEMFNYFVDLLLAQNRTVDNLNAANERLKEQQQQIKKTNELLGLQKIELQAANKKINRSHDEMSVQNEIAGAITSTVDIHELLNGICRTIRVRLDLDFVCIVLEPVTDNEFELNENNVRNTYLSTTMSRDYESYIKKRIMDGELDELLELSGTYVQNDDDEKSKLTLEEEESKKLESVIIVPLKKKEDNIGNLIVGKRSMNAFMDNKAFYENIANQLNMGVENIRMYSQMKQMAIRDGLTRIYNRRHLTMLVNNYLGEALKNRTSVSIALFDIDKFKQVNDTYGHLCGDAVICHVAQRLQKAAVQNGGIAGRYGGEEFVIAFRDKKLSEVYDIVKQVHEKIRNEEVPFEDKTLNIRVSAGIASYPETCLNPAELVSRADWAMYHSKRTGRDRITIDSDDIDTSM